MCFVFNSLNQKIDICIWNIIKKIRYKKLNMRYIKRLKMNRLNK